MCHTNVVTRLSRMAMSSLEKIIVNASIYIAEINILGINGDLNIEV